MSQALVGRLAVKAKQIKPGDAFAVALSAGQVIEITDLDGRQVAELIAFVRDDPRDRFSPAATRSANKSIMLQLGMTLYSTRGTALLELVEDTVGRHDLLSGVSPDLIAVPEPVAASTAALAADSEQGSDGVHDALVNDVPVSAPAEPTGGAAPSSDAPVLTANGTVPHASEGQDEPSDSAGEVAEAVASASGVAMGESAPNAKPAGFAAALSSFDLDDGVLPDPVNLFMNVAIKQRGELEVREPLSERGDHVVFKALVDVIVAVRASTHTDVTNGERPSDVLVRVYR